MNEKKRIDLQNQDEDFGSSAYAKWIHKFGRISTGICLFALYSIPLFSAVITGTVVDFKLVLLSLASLLPFIVIGATESFSYAPVMAASGTYIGFITGRLQPCFGPITSQMDKHHAQPNDKKHEIIASIVTGTMSLTVIAIMVVSLFCLNFIAPFLESPVLKPGYDNMMSAMIGAFAVPMIIKLPKLTLSPAVILIILTALLGSAKIIGMQSVLLPIMLIVGLAVNFGLYKLHFLDSKAKENEKK